MKTYFRILNFGKPFSKNILVYIFLTLFYVVFSMVNFSVLIPLLNVLFDQVEVSKIQNITFKPDFSFSIEYFKNNFYYYFGNFLNEGGRKEALKFVCTVIIISVFLANIFRYLSSLILAKIGVKIITNLRKKVYESILLFHISYFTNKKKGDIISRLTTDIQQIETSIINSLRIFLKEPALLIGLFFILGYLSLELTIYTFILIPISGLIISYLANKLKVRAALSQSALGKINNVIDETLSGIRIIKAFTANLFMIKKFDKEIKNYGNQNLSMYKRFELASPMSEFLGIATVTGILIIGGNMVLDNKSSLTASEFIAFIIIFSQVLKPAKAISDAYAIIQRGLASADRVFELIDLKPIINEKNKGFEIKDLKTEIIFSNVNFSYEKTSVLKNISIKIKKGESIALVGPSGGGKSTLIDLLNRLYDCSNGKIIIDGKNIKEIKIDNLRNIIGVVTQESILFHDSIKNNISFGHSKINHEQIKMASKVANASDFIGKLEEKYDTIIGERGLKLSGGQRQRICIARAIYKDPPILILDEATSSLDSEAEKKVQTAIEKVMKNRTSIIIAHRLSTIKNCDKIIIIDKGKIVGEGNHNDLIKKNNKYKKLIEMQNIT